MAEEMVDFGFSAVTADEYEKDNTDGENTGSGGSASPEALAALDYKIEQIMGALSSKSDEASPDFGFTQEDKEKQDATLAGIEEKIDKILSLEQDEERSQTTADILAQLNDATGESRTSSAKATEAVGKQDEIMKFLESMSPKIDKILKLESLESLLEGTSGKLDDLTASQVQSVTAEPPDLTPIMEKLEWLDKDVQKILKMEQLEAVTALQKSSTDMTSLAKELEERKKDIDLKYKSRMLAVEKLIIPLIENLMKDGNTKEYIRWPNRIPILEAQKQKIVQVTRSEL
ncbi:MAG: hypothetical protein QGH83_08125 [Candidatus Pacebacteria bacterium]|jgi:hypothetical protein|nr:hypothetical protein [Candidatus Paceibacterota bacterium]